MLSEICKWWFLFETLYSGFHYVYPLPYLHHLTAIEYACDICDYAPQVNNCKTHIADKVACLPPYAFLKEDCVAMYLFHPATVKNASVLRHGLHGR